MPARGRKGDGTRTKAASSKPSAPPKKETIAFDYIKGNLYRVISVNGVVGGLAPNGDIHMGIWSQRAPYPRQVVHEINAEGELGNEVGRDQRDSLIREIEAGLVFNAEMAAAMIGWLQKRLTESAGLRALTAAAKGGKDGQESASPDAEHSQRDDEPDDQD